LLTVPWSAGVRLASWTGSPVVTNVEPDPSFLGNQLGWYQPTTLDGFYWFEDLAALCLGQPASQCWAFLNNLVGGQWQCTPISYNAVTGGSTWSVPLTSGYRPGETITIGPIPPCFPWPSVGTPLLTVGPFVSAAPDFGDWGPGGWTWIDPGPGAKFFHFHPDPVFQCGAAQRGVLTNGDLDVSPTEYICNIVSWNPGTATLVAMTSPSSPYLPSTSVTVVIV